MTGPPSTATTTLAAVAVNPLTSPVQAARRWLAVGALAIPLLAWALWPTTTRESAVALAASPPSTLPAQPQRPPLRVAAFDAPIWTFDPPPPAPVAPPAPLRLQLVAMVGDAESGTLKALIYDPDTDELVTVTPGARIGTPPRTIASIDTTGVTLTDGRRLLMEGGAP